MIADTPRRKPGNPRGRPTRHSEPVLSRRVSVYDLDVEEREKLREWATETGTNVARLVAGLVRDALRARYPSPEAWRCIAVDGLAVRCERARHERGDHTSEGGLVRWRE